MAEDIKKPETGEVEDQESKTKDQPTPMEDPVEQLRQLCRGTLKLFSPIRAAGQDITELKFDFVGLTTTELLDALDAFSSMNTSIFAITNKQALAIFAATAGKCTEHVDARDVRERISGVDSVKAVQLAKLFWIASNRAGNKNISNG